MRRLGRGYGRPWNPEHWVKAWQQRGPQQPTTERLLRRNEIERFRLMLAAKEPKCP